MTNLIEARNYLLKNLHPVISKVNGYFIDRNFSTRKKSEIDFVTSVDSETEKMIKKILLHKYPDIPVISEESDDKYIYDGFYWLVDPLDGTINFLKGDPNFAVSIALVYGRKPVLGIIYNHKDDSLYWAADDSNSAYKNDKKIKIKEKIRLEDSSLSSNLSHDPETRINILKILVGLSGKVSQIKILGSAVNDALSVLKGDADIYFDIGHRPWDLAAAGFITEKAGLIVNTLDGDFDVYSKSVIISNGALPVNLFRSLEVY
jgi:myo-inositol-1(or 4)-monophosphatase